MAVTDPLGDMLTRIRNGQQARKDSVVTPASKLRVRVLEVLQREGYIRGYSEEALGAANRCELTGRSRAYYRKFRLSRVMLRELGNKGLIPGLTKSSW